MQIDMAQKIQEETAKVANNVDMMYLRKLQSKMHKCAANCCDTMDNATIESVNRCVEDCMSQFNKARTFVVNEFNNLQDRLNRCHMACGDKIRDKMSATPTESEIQKYRGELELCANKCAETHIEVVRQLFTRFKEYFNKEYKEHFAS
ncbi:UNVERIFIED_CONTAM: hypothetical protein PYX00_009895 [Menopon gallinae]|uniref:Protein FAM136A n=1 Tax=Menopon gallinae TaxID=328185 RepID=A0AAW2HDE8_9NEOP